MKLLNASCKVNYAIFVFLLTFYSTIDFAQCSFTGLDPTYCIDDEAVTLTPSPSGGTFSGPGMTGDEFDPAAAGPGVHTITYEVTTGGDRYYMKSSIGNPWGNTTNNAHMNTAFGPGGWTLDSFEGCDVATVFSITTSFVFLDGSDGHANELNTFLTANLPAIEAWVDAGGSLLINSAPNEGGDIDFGFGGTTLDYISYENTVTGVDAAHSVFLGPNLPTNTAMSGTYYSHARILGVGYTNILVNGSDVVLCEKDWGLGHVAMGGMTTTNFHNPDPHADNFRANLLTYLDGEAVTGTCIYEQDVEVFDLPEVDATADNEEICDGESVTLSGTGADTYTWDLGVTDGAPFTPGIGSETYTVTGEDAISGCINVDSIEITVHENPTVTGAADLTEICLGDEITFTGSGADTYTWDGGVTDGVAFEPLTTGSFTFTVVGEDATTGCTGEDAVDIEVFETPTVNATASETEICLGESITFTGTGAEIYTWDGGVTDGVAFEPVASGTFTFTVEGEIGATGCSDTDEIDITVFETPTVTASATETELCEGESTTLSASGADAYSWDGGVVDGVSFTPPLGTTTYTVTGTTDDGCDNTASIDITVSPVPTVTATASDTEICLGETITFTGTGAEIYTWDGGVTDGVPFEPVATGTFTFNLVGEMIGSDCSDTDAIEITVFDSPIVTATATETELCEGESTTLNAGGADSYSWDGGVTDGVAFVPPLGTTTYTVVGTTIDGCENTSSVEITVNPTPTVTASASDLEVCFGSDVTLSGGGADTYAWDGGITNGIPFTPTDMGSFTYEVTGTTAEGCESTATVTIEVIDCEPVFANFEFDNNVCLGDCIELTNLSEGPVESNDWTFGGAVDPDVSSEESPVVCFNAIGTYTITLTVTSENGATSSINSTITVNDNPTISVRNDTIIDVGGSALLSVSGATSGTFIWTPDEGLSCPECEFTQASPENTTTYQVYYIDENGCTDQDTVKVWVNFAIGIGVPSGFSPNGDGENDVLFVKGFGISAINFRVFNRYGELIFESDNQEIGWDGTYQNREENPGVFTWVLNYSLEDGSSGMLKGNTTLVR